MNINILSWRYIPFLMLLALWLPAGNAQAAINCTASMPTINFGSITPDRINNATISSTLNYKCNNTFFGSRKVSVCLAIDGGDYTSTVVFPRYMSTGAANPRLAFTMTLPGGALWSTRGNLSGGSEYKSVLHDIPARSSIDIDVPINISLIPSNGNSSATAGVYTNNFNGGHTALTTAVGTGSGNGIDCSTGAQQSIRFPFRVEATVIKDCNVSTAADVTVGGTSVSAAETNITGNTVISVACTNATPYFIGLRPSNNSTVGAGVMSGTGGNTNKVGYQLRSTTGSAGKLWGNTATSTTVGNGVADTGTGLNKTHEVFVTVPSVDFKPDNYSDTVTISVNY